MAQIQIMNLLLQLANNIKMKLIEKLNIFKNNVIYCFLPFINLNSNITPESLDGFNKFLFGILIISIILLWCFISIVGYLLSLYVIKYTKLEEKYPKLKPFIGYFQSTNYVLIVIEIIIFIATILGVIGICIKLLYFNN